MDDDTDEEYSETDSIVEGLAFTVEVVLFLLSLALAGGLIYGFGQWLGAQL